MEWNYKFYDIRGLFEKFGDTLFHVGTLWRCGDGLFFEVPPLASDALLTTLHQLNEKRAADRLPQASGG
jgi:hypothetical protein